MDKLFKVLNRYTFGFFNLTSGYCNWAARHASNQGELVMLALAPGVVAGLLIWILPNWIAKPLAFILIVPFLHVAFLVVRELVQRSKEQK